MYICTQIYKCIQIPDIPFIPSLLIQALCLKNLMSPVEAGTKPLK